MNKSKCFILLTLFAFSCLLVLLIPSARAWQVSISDCQGCGSRAEAAVVDAAGDVIATGSFFYGADVVKLSGATGQVIWRSEVMGHESRNYVQDIAIDSRGDVFVVFAWTRVVIKVSGSTGMKIWEKPIGGTINAHLPMINAVAVDRDNNVVTAGTVGGLLNVCKLDGSTGDETWHYEREGLAKAVAVDPFGNVAAAGIMSRNLAVVKLRGENGEELWQREINGAGNFSNDFEEANAVAMDKDGSVVVAGVTSNEIANFRDFTVAKYLPDGSIKWIEIVDGNYILQNDRGERFKQSNDIAYAVTIDKDGNVIAAGSIQEDDDVPATGNNPEHFRVVKIARDGGVDWSVPAEDHTFGEDYIPGHAFAVSMDDAGDVVAGGVHAGRFTVIKFKATGERAWPPHQINSGGLGNGNNALSVVMDTDRNIVAAGEIIGSDGWQKFTVVKLRGEDGTDYFATPIPTPSPTPTPDFEGALRRYIPMLKFDSSEKYFPLAVESITDNRGNKLVRKDERSEITLAQNPQTRNIPLLKIDFLEELYPNNDPSLERDWLFEAKDHENDARRFQSNLRYRDRIYGRIVYGTNPRGRKIVWLQYWFFYYYNDYMLCLQPIGCTNIKVDHHEGDWEMIQIALASNAEPVSVLYAQHDYASQCTWNEIEKDSLNNERPIVYVARGSHASYFHAGRHQIKLPGVFDIAFDRANGKGTMLDPKLEIIKDDPSNWSNWKGHWGGTQKREVSILLLPIPPQIKAILIAKCGLRCRIPVDGDSPRGPKFQGDKWHDPPAFSAGKPFNCL